MNAYRTNSGCSGTAYDRWVEQHGAENTNKSALTKMQHQYWVTKETVFRKLGKKEDECIVASDAELDAKLELFRSIQESCLVLQRIIDRYQERLCTLAQEENSMGRFLKEAGKTDKTRAGKMMTAVGKSLSYSGQQRLTLRVPLIRLYQEVETFRHRAIEDTLQNVNGMEKARTEYRASLSWMKNVSQELDPDTYKQLERFRKVQTQVRRSKVRFDKLKLDCLQKVDLLAAARCNMFSHALILYQNSLLQFAEKTSKTFTTISNSFKGYQHYDFCVVKELTEPSLKLAEQISGSSEDQPVEEEDKDKLLFFESEYHDAAENASSDTPADKNKCDPPQNKSESLENLYPPSQPLSAEYSLVDLDFEKPAAVAEHISANAAGTDLLTNSADDILLLDEIFGASDGQSSFGSQWDEVFGDNPQEDSSTSFLLDHLASLQTTNDNAEVTSNTSLSSPNMALGNVTENKTVSSPVHGPSRVKEKDKKAAWFNLFAELDPLADPDALGSKNTDGEHNC
ncbi:islet cell autoantigen 1 isoform X1 [Schistocerca serialis cubense]|uniref:islet cell autoantigen 1 isoform X1 n=1 Tax=Schistocerca serialis cubense TaxID=2023355 RepID=UPI00214EA83E|nr:islet cell autoantigen 1 isoform X1 [Schistocerca serialis cubense]